MISTSLAPSTSGLSSVANLASTQSLRPVAQRACLRQSTLQIENKVAIRFQRFGRKKKPFYRLVAIDSRSRRDGRPLERLGHYDPLKKETNLDAPAIKKWLEVGAVPSDTVSNLLKKAMVIE
ncbi:ribosomal protein S16 [Coccomyxa subellipsoidea C-169]|uniref:30S ribosomal protein S16, chloroplastic n=1 Tax=Coccomyxa subellipsoidea (strain C-169) TaxID=574566 RepID=I0YWP8_COCSC|nr:ribosomal protein S16 [Coccomyxa subellipsoidea C-169]EIE22817.1 ribosomal protein S16 [Coccomyxa subellipsoidea C-169]|eukprot:XP_005647361.1 ribosomal protein S16 [Coccomyxa subellipsoidea C-169]